MNGNVFFIFFILLTIVILGGAAAVVTRFVLHEIHRKNPRHRIFLVTIPQFANVTKPNAEERFDFKDRLAEVEDVFAVLASIRAERGVRAVFCGRSDHLTLEIVNHRGTISFYAAIPPHLCELFTQQIHSIYPHAHLDEVMDYNIFQPQSVILAGYLVFRRSFIFPFRTYKSFERDPLENITTALSRVPKNGGAAVQFVLRSAYKSWHTPGKRVAEAVYHGTPLREAIRAIDKPRGGLAITYKLLSSVFSFIGSSVVTKPKHDDDQKLKAPKQVSQKDQEAVKGIEDKLSKAGFDVNIRIVVSMPDQSAAELHLRNIMESFGQFNIYEYGNAFKPLFYKNHDRIIQDFIYRHFEPKTSMVINSEEMTSLIHLPEMIKTPSVNWLMARKTPPPTNMPYEGIVLGHNIYRDKESEVRIKDSDRLRHVYIIGQTGTGKTTLMETMAIQDIRNGKGVGILDPHGDLVERLLGHVPKERIEDVIYFNPADTDRPLGLNMLEFQTPDQKTFVINEMIKIFDKLYDLRATGGPMFEQYMRNTMLLMMEDPESGSTLLEVPKVLADEKFRKYKLSKSTNIVVKDFWEKEAQKAGGEAALANMVPYITSKLNQFVSNDIMRPIISQQVSSFNFRTVMDQQKILLINLSKGRIGEMNSSLLGMVIVGKLLMAALSRVDMPEHERKDFYLYIDEFQNYTTDSIAIILSEARKYRLALHIAHQYLGQLVKGGDTSIKDAVFGNVGTIIAYRVGVEDVEQFAEQFMPVVSEYDLMNIEKFNFYIRLLIDNQNAPAFNVRALMPSTADQKIAQLIKELSRQKYGRPRADVEHEIYDRTRLTPAAEPHLPPVM